MKPFSLKKVFEEGPISENRSMGKRMVRKWFLNINSVFSLQRKYTTVGITTKNYLENPSRLEGERVRKNLSVSGLVGFAKEASESLLSPFAS